MVNFDLGRKFDVVTCLFSSIAYVKTLVNMEKAVASMARHVEEGGLLFVEPWFSPQTYWVGRVTANHVDEPELKIAWMYTSEIEDRVSIFDIHYLVGNRGDYPLYRTPRNGAVHARAVFDALKKSGMRRLMTLRCSGGDVHRVKRIRLVMNKPSRNWLTSAEARLQRAAARRPANSAAGNASCRINDLLERRWLTNDGPYVRELEEDR
jgi:hypothetical protein